MKEPTYPLLEELVGHVVVGKERAVRNLANYYDDHQLSKMEGELATYSPRIRKMAAYRGWPQLVVSSLLYEVIERAWEGELL